jgi:hypothetical protein
MFFPIIAAIITLVGVVGFVISSLVNGHASAAGDLVFNAATICIVAGPLIFFSYGIIGLCIEFASINQKHEVKIAAAGPSLDRPAAPLGHVAFDEGLPEGLQRERKGPLNPHTGRANKI